MTNVIRTTLMLAGLTGLLLLFGGFVGGRSGIFLAPPIAATIIQLAISRGRELDVESGIICKNQFFNQYRFGRHLWLRSSEL